MGGLELDQLGNVRLVLERARVLTVFHKSVATQCLERHLHEGDGIFVVQLVQEEFIQLEQLVTLDVLDLLLTTDVLKFGYRLREFEVDERVHSI